MMPLYAGLSRQPCETHHGDNQNQGRDAKKAFYSLKEPIKITATASRLREFCHNG